MPSGQQNFEEKHETSASDTRVTPEEFTQALSAIESRRENTLTIGEGVSAVAADISPEEILAEIQAQKPVPVGLEPVTQDEKDTYAEKRERPRNNFLTAIVAACVVVGIALFINHTPETHTRIDIQRPGPFEFHQREAHGRVAIDPDTEFYQKLNQSTGPAANYRIVVVRLGLFPDDMMGPRLDGTVYPVRAVPDGYTLYSASGQTAMYRIFDNLFGAGVIFVRTSDWSGIARGPGGNNALMLATRYNGLYYTRGWIKSDQVETLKNGERVFLSSTPEPSMVPVTLPAENKSGQFYPAVDRFSRYPFLNGDPGVTLHDLKKGQKAFLDEHAWENFPETTLPTYTPPEWAKQPGIFQGYRFPLHLSALKDHEIGELGFDGSSDVRLFSTIPDGQVIHCNGVTLENIFADARSKANLELLRVDARPELHQRWQIVKYSGHVYMRGWVVTKLSAKQVFGKTITVYSDPNSTDFIVPPVPITLRVDQCHYTTPEASARSRGVGVSPTARIFRSIYTLDVSDIHLDEHAWEK